MKDLLYANGIGGFREDGREYCIRVSNEQKTPLPWSHILANSKMGTLVTSNGGGFSWYGNSRENKLTAWSNDAILDTPSEKILLQDEKAIWGAMPTDIWEKEEYELHYGFGYVCCELCSERYKQGLNVFLREETSQKVSILTLKNLQNTSKTVTIRFLINPVLGVDKAYTQKHLVVNFEKDHVQIRNHYHNDYENAVLKLRMVTTEESSFTLETMGEFVGLKGAIKLAPQEEKQVIMILEYSENEKAEANGQEEDILLQEGGWKKQINEYVSAYESEKQKWSDLLGKIQVHTPMESLNIMLNGWAIYQALASRIFGRASFYQSGGAYGFRDQLQDMLAILYVDTALVKKQILYHAAHQFPEGDVLHWWHPERNNGIRTRFSDDLLWLAYVTCEYIDFTGDFPILWERIPFIEGPKLKENEDECYIETHCSEEEATLFEHCIRAINRSLDFGDHHLPKMGSGDWNDGMNMVGGESVWLGFFLAEILRQFIKLLKSFSQEDSHDEMNSVSMRGKEKMKISEEKKVVEEEDISEDQEAKWIRENRESWQETLNLYQEKYKELSESLNLAWDGRWFRRAYFKTGETLGSNQNDECKIDNISQSWSVISDVVSKEKQKIAMESVENYLVDHENMLIKLLTPAFCHTKLEPGYIKSYIPGVRENGGQYTQVCCC